MYTINPPMLPPDTVFISVERSLHTVPAQPHPFTVLVGLEQHRESKRLEPCDLAYPHDELDPEMLQAWLRQMYLFEFSHSIMNEERAGCHLRIPVSTYKPLTLYRGVHSKPVLDLMAIPHPTERWRYDIVSRAALVPLLEDDLRDKQPNPRVYADVGVSLLHIKIEERGLALCQWLMMQGYGIISLASDGDPQGPVYSITVKTPWANKLIAERGF